MQEDIGGNRVVNGKQEDQNGRKYLENTLDKVNGTSSAFQKDGLTCTVTYV